LFDHWFYHFAINGENWLSGVEAVCFGRKQLLAVAQFIVGIVEKTRFLGIRLMETGKELGTDGFFTSGSCICCWVGFFFSFMGIVVI
jgi:hypothetical protein